MDSTAQTFCQLIALLFARFK